MALVPRQIQHSDFHQQTIFLTNISKHTIVIPIQSQHFNAPIKPGDSISVLISDITDEIRMLTSSKLLAHTQSLQYHQCQQILQQ